MKSTPSVFQLVVLVSFLVLGVIGVIIFASSGAAGSNKVPSATIWGTVSSSQMALLAERLNLNKQIVDIQYTQIPAEKFQNTFVNAIAEGNGPDLVLLSDSMLYSEQGKIETIPYASFDQRTYSDTYLNAADHFLTYNGIQGIPFTVDPIVMYYNRNMFSTAGISAPPTTWGELQTMVPKIAKINDTKGIVKAAVALGEARNVTNSKEILVSMLMQSGNPITMQDSGTGQIKAVLDNPASLSSGQTNITPGEVVDFYSQFSDPVSPQYTWSRSMPESRRSFLAGDLAIYFGYASDYQALKLENPNLDFDVALIPQNSADYNVTYGKILALSLVKRSTNMQAAFQVMNILTSATAQQVWVDISSMPPVRKDMLGQVVSDKFLSVFYRAAIQTKTWTDPDPEYSTIIFRDLIESVTTGFSPANEAITTARQRLQQLLGGVRS